MKVLIADDEIKVCNLLTKLIDWDALGLEIIGIANDGIAAVALAKSKSPDIIITDIRMPGYSGIELIECVKNFLPSAHFIIISGYRQFEYAKQAIKYGVEDYLLKPLKQNEMEQILKKIIRQHQEALMSIDERENMIRTMNQSYDVLQSHFITLLVENDPSLVEITMKQANEAYHLRFTHNGFCVLLIHTIIPKTSESSGKGDLLEKKIKNALEKYISPSFYTILHSHAPGNVICIVNGEAKALEALPELARMVLRDAAVWKDIFGSIQIHIAISGLALSFQELPHCVHQANVAMMQRLLVKAGTLSTYDDAYTNWEPTKLLNAHIRNDLKKAITLLDATSSCKTIQDIQKQLQNTPHFSGWMAWEVVNQLFGLLSATMMDNGVLLPSEQTSRFQELPYSVSSVSALFETLQDIYQKAIGFCSQEKDMAGGASIRKAKQYIQEHYAQPITLSEISAEVGLNASYFSSLFKRETGENYLEYLTKVRINVAKELLIKTDMSISEIAENVGYLDLKYMYKRFKQLTGVSLQKYRSLYR